MIVKVKQYLKDLLLILGAGGSRCVSLDQNSHRQSPRENKHRGKCE